MYILAAFIFIMEVINENEKEKDKENFNRKNLFFQKLTEFSKKKIQTEKDL